MKKLTFSLALIAVLVSLSHVTHAQLIPAQSLTISNITTTSANLTFVIGSDEIGSMIQSHQGLKLKYRPVPSGTLAAQTINGTEKEIPLNYTVNTPNPLQPVTLSGLNVNQRYAIWIGQQAVKECQVGVLCNAVYTKYTNQPIFFSTKLDPSKVATLTKNLSFQAKSSDVVILKKYVSANGYMMPSTTTSFDIPTLVGVIKFQIAQHMNADGTVGSGSRAIINQWLVTQAQQ